MAGPAIAGGLAAGAPLKRWLAGQALQQAAQGPRRLLHKLIYLLLGLLGLLGLFLPLLFLLMLPALLFRPAFAGEGGVGRYPAGSGIPRVYWSMYASAAGYYEVNPYLLASIHKHETGFSGNPAAREGWNQCKAAGPMQFGVVGVSPYNAPAGGCSAGGTWGSYSDAFRPIRGARPASYPLDRRRLESCRAVPADTGCVYDDFDAIAGAAKKLAADGAKGSLSDPGTRAALLAYNNSDSYADSVLEQARAWEQLGAAAIDVPVGDTAPRTFERLMAVANAIDGQTEQGQIPYCFGGGHGPRPGPSGGRYCWHGTQQVYGSPRSGLDCSGAVRWLLVQSGYPDPGGIASAGYGGYLRPGSGGRVTFYYNDNHIYVQIHGRTWQTSTSNRNHGPGWTAPRSAADFTAGYVEGL